MSVCSVITTFSISCVLCLNYPDDAIDYVLKWTEDFATFKDFTWVVLQRFIEWPNVKKSMQILSERFSFDVVAHSSAVFEQYGYIKSFCNNEKLAEWIDNNVPTDKRWVEIFKHMKTEQIPFDQFSRIIEFVLCFPGTSAPVERVFAKAKKVWTQESSNLHIITLNSILHVKNNMEWNCVDFYKFLETQPQLLHKIARYDFKQPKPVDASGPGAMSADVAVDEDVE